MIEKLVDVWLTEASERSYETAFSQLLVIEGHRVIQGPMHHSHEHGKDIIGWNTSGELCVYQLKGGQEKLDTAGVESAQDQLLAAAAASVTHPSLVEPRPPDRVFLVTNQTATGPAQDRIRVLSDGNEHRGMAPLHLIENAELLSRFVNAGDRFFPSSPTALNAFLSLFLADGRGPLPRRQFFQLLESILPVTGARPKASEAGRAVSAAAVTTAFALRKWTDEENYAEVALGWICYATQVFRLVERTHIGRNRWYVSYRLALEEARRNVRRLLVESTEREDLVIPDFSEPIVHSARVVKVCGLVSALAISERIEFGSDYEFRGTAGQLIDRERTWFRVVGEVQAPDYFLSILALEEAGKCMTATSMLLSWVSSVATSNHPDSTFPLPDPYHSVEDVILDQIPPQRTILADEDFSGSSYTICIGVRWAVRRLWRQALNSMWGNVSRLQHFWFEPERPIGYLEYRSERGSWNSWFYPTPSSWAQLRGEAEQLDMSALPRALLSCPEMFPFYCLAMPHRFNIKVADLLDELAYRGCLP